MAKIVKEESADFMQDIKTLIRDEIQSALSNIPLSATPSHSSQPPRKSQGCMSDSDSPDSTRMSDLEEGERGDDSSDDDDYKKYLFNPEDTEELIKAIRATLKVEQPKKSRSIQDDIFGGLGERRKLAFPVHENIQKIIKDEWKKPDKKFFIPKAIKRRYPFEEGDCTDWDSVPKVDVPLAKVAKHTSLPFEDASQLKDPLDRKAESLLKRTWEAASDLLRPGVAATCVARTLSVWLEQLEFHLQSKTPRDQILESLPLLKMATSFLADASAETVKLSARTSVLSNSVRRVLWLKSWSGDLASKNKLCSLPFYGQFIFGPDLDKILERASDKKKGFPEERSRYKNNLFRTRQGNQERGKGKTGRWSYAKGGRGRNFLFNPSRNESKP